MFVLDAPLAETVVRGAVVYLALLFMPRAAGQRESGGLGLTDVLIVVLVAQAVSGGLGGGSRSVTDGLVLVATILVCSLAVDAAAYRFPRFAAVVKARPRPLIRDGRLNRPLMRREFMSTEEVLSRLRLHGVHDPAQVHLAYLEPNGMISVLRRGGEETDTPVRPPAE
ncbi:hypothetical protein CUT44_27585 [Streptomyces carminius]|uniref:YetF C-terminal domain-containing protein n=2 Tax=Streptomyces carminius TaxID=2665496 RepID=A0A2M8LRN0_9ACTN|nr:hypothetical protein CUT44_27585 [Streptomyces carminius]